MLVAQFSFSHRVQSPMGSLLRGMSGRGRGVSCTRGQALCPGRVATRGCGPLSVSAPQWVTVTLNRQSGHADALGVRPAAPQPGWVAG